LSRGERNIWIGMKSPAAYLLICALVAGGVSVVCADSTGLPPGLTQSNGVIMMQPIQDFEGADKGPPAAGERRAGLIHALSASDHDIYSRAFDAADRGDWTAARSLAAQGQDTAARRLIEWRYMLDKDSGAPFDQIDAFLKVNPEWPLRDTLYARAEQTMDLNMTPAQVIAWFGARKPASAIGKIRLGEALVAAGEVAVGGELIRQAWIGGSFEPDQELAIVQKDGAFLNPEIDRQRLNDLLWREDIASARRELARVTVEAGRIAQTRMLLRTDSAAGEKMALELPQDLASDPELLFDRARAARRLGDNPRAESLILQALSKGAGKGHPGRLWAETNIIAREALKDGDYKTAYRILSGCGLSEGEEFAECEFLAGWVALRFLKDAKAALPHFQKLEAGVSRPISLARARYWEGRAYEALGDAPDAWRKYQMASDAPTAFYGQLALARIERNPVLSLSEARADPASVKADFERDDLTHAMRVLADLGEASLLRTFALRSEELHSDAAHVATLAQALVDMGFREIAVRVAKLASYDDLPLLRYTHPVIPIPSYQGPGAGPEPALVLGLIRQETEFDPSAVSGPGARGIMQIMPATARHSASLAGLPYRPNDLLTDTNYNIQLGMAEYGAALSDWGGSVVLATAAYNAGATNVRKWLNSNGDPRSPATDPIDWIEQIPFNETRNYVERVLENMQVYRNRLAGRSTPLKILSDLYRPNPPVAIVLDYTPPPPPTPEPKPETAAR
jgi:soluble lytic murein transglycosylase